MGFLFVYDVSGLFYWQGDDTGLFCQIGISDWACLRFPLEPTTICLYFDCSPMTSALTKLLTAIMVCSLAALITTGCGKRSNFPQTQGLTDGTKIRMEAAWIFDGPKPLLRVKFAYLGTDPNERYLLHAALRDRPDADDWQSQYVWQFGLSRKPSTPANETPMCWEFRDFPRNSEKVYLRIHFQSKTNSSMNEKLEFVLPPVKRLELRDASTP